MYKNLRNLSLIISTYYYRYFRDEMTARNVHVINKLRSNTQRVPKKVSDTLRCHNQTAGLKYSFPRDVRFDGVTIRSI